MDRTRRVLRAAGAALVGLVLLGPAAAVARPGSEPPSTAPAAAARAGLPPAGPGAGAVPTAVPVALPPVLQQALERLPFEIRPVDPGQEAWAVDVPNYRADFSADGVRFTPRGPAVHTPATWRYRLHAIESGERSRIAGAVTPVVRDNVVEYVRPGLVERYIAGANGVEQVWVIDQRPEGGGGLAIVGAVETPLAARSSGGAIDYRDAQQIVVTYGAPRAWDARHRPVAVRSAQAGSWHRLVIDASALRDAEFPITIDPIIANATWVYWYDSARPQVAYNSKRGEFLVAFDIGLGATGADRQVRVKRYSETGLELEASRAMGSGLTSDHSPAIAYSAYLDEYLLVWVQHIDWPMPFPPFIVRANEAVVAQRLDSEGVQAGTAVQLSAASVAPWPAEDTNEFPDVVASNLGYQGLTSQYLVSWRHKYGPTQQWSVQVELVAVIGGTIYALGESAISAQSSSLGDVASAFDPFTNHFFVVWSDSAAIRGRSMSNWNGTFGTLLGISDANAVAPVHPDVAFDLASRQYLVVWRDDRSSFGWTGHIYGQLLTSATTPAAVNADFLIDANDAIVWSEAGAAPNDEPVVVAERGGFIVTYERIDGGTGGSGTDTDLYASHVTADGTVSVIGLGRMYTDTDTDDDVPAIAMGTYGFAFETWKHMRQTDWPQVWSETFVGRYTHYVHGTSGDTEGGSGGAAGGDLLIFRPSAGAWYVRPNSGASSFSRWWGTTGDLPALVDYDGDGEAELGVFRPSSGTWFMLDPASGATWGVQWGAAGDVPVPGDYVGNVQDDLAVFRLVAYGVDPFEGYWYIRDGQTGAGTALQWGQLGDVPVPADYDGDGKTELAVWRPYNGIWYSIEVSGAGGQSVQWGGAGDIPLAGNFVGSAAADYVVFRPESGAWFIRDGATGAGTVTQWGTAGDVPMPIDYDADGHLDLVVWRPSTGTWFVRLQNGTQFPVAWGTTGDIPVGGPRGR